MRVLWAAHLKAPSLNLCGVLPRWILSSARRASTSGNGMYTRFSNRRRTWIARVRECEAVRRALSYPKTHLTQHPDMCSLESLGSGPAAATAGSSAQGKLVAPSTSTPSAASDMRTSNSFLSRRDDSDSESERLWGAGGVWRERSVGGEAGDLGKGQC